MRSTTERMKSKGGPVGRVMVGVLRVYQYSLSPVFYAFGIRCRHEPTCSHYAIHAVRRQHLA